VAYGFGVGTWLLDLHKITPRADSGWRRVSPFSFHAVSCGRPLALPQRYLQKASGHLGSSATIGASEGLDPLAYLIWHAQIPWHVGHGRFLSVMLWA
jgi:hypothetical protein